MRQLTSTVTSKGQTTIPIEVRRLLGLRPRDKVAFVVDGGEVRVVKIGSVVERTRGALKSNLPPLTAKQLREEAERAIADSTMERSGFRT